MCIRDRVTVTCLLLSLLFSIIAFAKVAIGGEPITIDLARAGSCPVISKRCGGSVSIR